MIETLLELTKAHPYIAGFAGMAAYIFFRKIFFTLVILSTIAYFGLHYAGVL
jgi:hypothetical protein